MAEDREGRVDRRVRRTRELLRAALLALIMEKGYARITVQDIIDRADIGRSTFYAHFRDKEDLLFYGLEELRGAFHPADAAGAHTRTRGQSPTLAVFEHFAAHREVWKAMAGKRGSEAFSRYLHEFLADLLRVELGARLPDGEPSVPLDAVVEFATSSLIGLGVRWGLEHDQPYTPEQMDALYRKLTEPGIGAALRPRP
jgi:AcrR family transcriptional regulator